MTVKAKGARPGEGWTRERVTQLLAFAQELWFLRKLTDLQLPKILEMFEATVALPVHGDAEADAASLRAQLAEARAAAPRWVPVTERLPEKGGPYLVHVPGRAMSPSEVSWFNTISGEFEQSNATHWMPLPSAPAQAEERTKEGSENGQS